MPPVMPAAKLAPTAPSITAVRNSGAEVVIEGCGSNGCEYMTGGTAVILGAVGANFAAGMTGGMAFVYDKDDNFNYRLNPENVIAQRTETDYWESVLKTLIERHVEQTQSAHAQEILLNWERERERFWQVVPKEMLHRLAEPVTAPEPLKILA
jgi:glutamate synthase (NADPH/NADH) large chain